MISDDPFEDFDDLDDEAVLDIHFGENHPKQTPAAQELPMLADWPPPAIAEAALRLDAATLAWFQANHANWRQEMRFVLRAWVAARSATQPNDQKPEPIPPAIGSNSPRQHP